MAQATGTHNKSTAGVAKEGELHQGPEHGRSGEKPHKRRHVTPEQRRRIRELYEAGMTGHEVAGALNMGRTTVYRYLALNKHRRPRWTEEEKQRLVDARFLGMRYAEISRIIGRSPRALMVAMCRHRKRVLSDPAKRTVLGAVKWGWERGCTVNQTLAAMRKLDFLRGVVGT